MTDAPERIWALYSNIFGAMWTGVKDEGADEYIRADLAKAQAGALLRQAADACMEAWPEDGTYAPHERDIEGAERATVEVRQCAILAIDPDAQAALDRYVGEAVEKATAKLRHNIQEATDADFIFGAMDNVADIDATLEEFANTVSGTIRAAIGGE